ncbi:MAG: hypothetical protein IJW40_02060 [Clostridia bacterium]|nr:hypothetical protein [Clostridia bacterium]
MSKSEFLSIIRDILATEEFQRMKKYRHHVKGNLYDHSVKVAYLCYLHHKKHGMDVDLAEFVRGALLHDYYLYDLHGCGRHRFHWFRHPRRALENAIRHYPGLTMIQRDMIRRHMFPVTLTPPMTREGWLLCFYDKVAAVDDRLRGSRRAARRKKRK